jgi:hypothetical protein
MGELLDISKPSFSDNLQVFYCPPTETAVQSVEWVDVRPIGQVLARSAIEFNLSGNSTAYLDLKNTRLSIKARILKENGEPIGADDVVGFANNTLHTLFNQCDVSVQQKLVTPNVSTNYAYKAMFDALLSNSDPDSLQSQLFYLDSAGFHDNLDYSRGGNLGLYQRARQTEKGKLVDLEGNVCMDICQQERYLLNGVQVNFKFWPSRDSFCLLSPNADQSYRIEVSDAVLKVCYVKLNPTVLLAHNDALQKQEALYPYTKSDVKCFGVPQGQYSVSVDDIFQGEIPEKLIVTLVASEAYSGSYRKNPYNFKHYDCNFVALYVDGRSVPSVPLEPNYESQHFVTSYLTLGMHNKHHCMIKKEDYNAGYCIYAFDVSHCSDGSCLPLLKRGHTRLDLKFAKPLPEAVTVICYAQFPGLMTIDSAREVRVR